MLMASIVASMMMGGFILTITGDVGDDDLTEASDDADVGNDLYADDAIGGVGGLEGWGDLLTDLMEDDSLYGGPEAVNANVLVPEGSAGTDTGSLDEDALLDADLASLLDDNITDEMETLFGGPWTTDGTEVLVYDFVPGEDELLLAYDVGSAVPEIDLFGDPAGNALVFADGHLAIKVMGADGMVLPDDVHLVAEEPDQNIASNGATAAV